MKQRIRDNPHMPAPELECEEVETICEDWMGTTDPEGYFRLGNGDELTWGEAMLSGEYCFYFGTTKRALEDECFRWMTPRGRPGGGRNNPILKRPDDSEFTMAQVKEELGFHVVELLSFQTRLDACAVEEYLQRTITSMHEVVVDGDPEPHRPLGIQLHRFPAKGPHSSEEAEVVAVFVCVGRITKSNFDLPYGDPRRRLMEINGVPVKVVP